MDGFRWLRWRARLAEFFAVVVLLALLVLALGGGLTYLTFAEPGTVTETETVASWQTAPTYDHQAVVQRDSLVFSEGTVLSNRGLYFTQLSPVLEGRFSYGVSGAPGEVDLDVTSTLLIRSVNDDGGVYWRVTEPLDEATVTIGTDQRVETAFEVNVTTVRQRIQAIESDLGTSVGTTEVLVRSAVSASGTVADEAFSDADTYTLEIDPGSETYTVESDAEGESFSRTREVTREETYGPARQAAGPLLILLGLAGLVGLAVGRHRGVFELSPAERDRLEFYADREEFDEWITTGSVPESARGGVEVHVDDLEGLVDVAIDSEARVIEDAAGGAYYVLGDELVYTYTPPAPASVPPGP